MMAIRAAARGPAVPMGPFLAAAAPMTTNAPMAPTTAAPVIPVATTTVALRATPTAVLQRKQRTRIIRPATLSLAPPGKT